MMFSGIHNIIRHNTTRYSSRHSVKCDKNQNYGDKNCILSAFCSTRSSHCVNWTSCINDMYIDMLWVAGRGVTLVLPTINSAGVADDQTGGRLVSSEYNFCLIIITLDISVFLQDLISSVK